MKRLLAYSLVESHQDSDGYSLHPVVHGWCDNSISRGDVDLIILALTTVKYVALFQSELAYWVVQSRLLAQKV